MISTTKLPESIDVLCRVIDNYGDIGVTLRLLRSLNAKLPKTRLRLIVEGLSEVAFVLRDFDFFETVDWSEFQQNPKPELIRQIDLIIETFGQGWPTSYPEVFSRAREEQPTLLINLEYLSNEDWVGEFHRLKGLIPYDHVRRYFFMPGLHGGTGGLNWHGRSIKQLEDYSSGRAKMLLFYYDYPPAIFLNSELDDKFEFYLGHGLTLSSFEKYLGKNPIPPNLRVLPRLNQMAWDEVLVTMDILFVRGEESLSHALCSGIPFLWQTYPLRNLDHKPKTRAIIDFVIRATGSQVNLNDWERLMLHINGLLSLGEGEHQQLFANFLDFATTCEGRLAFNKCAKEIAKAGDLIDNLFSFYQEMV